MMKHVIRVIGVLLLAGCGHVTVSETNGRTQDHQIVFPYDSIQGCWGTHPETGNSILCFMGKDSALWVDPSLWCAYTIENDTITMLLDTFVYFSGRIEYRNDTLFLNENEFNWEYERFIN